MTQVLTAAQMRRFEQEAMAAGVASGATLMERAGQGVLDAILLRWPGMRHLKGRALVLCGPGNNGGDGFVIARLLHGLGWQVDLRLMGDPTRLPRDAALNHARWSEIGDVAEFTPDLRGCGAVDLVVDALFGTGLTRPVAGLDQLGTQLAALQAPVVAVDIPSGLCADSGRGLGAVLRADVTVSFHSAKPGHFLSDGPAQCGDLQIASIGLEGDVPGAAQLLQAPLNLDKPGAGHKFSHGHALVLSGGSGRSGAARLAARAALRVGAGLVTLGAPPNALQEIACQITALMLTRIADAEGLRAALDDQRLTALCLGPGLGLERARELVPVALTSGRACVLDADALSAFQGAPQTLFETLHPACVLTPHFGEFARLFPDLAQDVTAEVLTGPAPSRLDAVRKAAARAGCTVLLKGPDTVIADEQGRVALNAASYGRAAPWLATAGSGDVLAGLITGLCARGWTGFEAACAGAWLHVETGRHCGPGLVAEDLPEALPQVLRGLISPAAGDTP